MTAREKSIAIPLFVLAIWFGVYPQVVLNYMDNTIDQQVQQLADWTRDVKEPALARQAEESEQESQAAGASADTSTQRRSALLVATTDRSESSSRTTTPLENAPDVGRVNDSKRSR